MRFLLMKKPNQANIVLNITFFSLFCSIDVNHEAFPVLKDIIRFNKD